MHPKKSSLSPTQRINFLGFIIDSVQMTLETVEKKDKFHNLCLEILQKENLAILLLASLQSIWDHF